MNFVDKDGTTTVYIPVHPCISRAQRVFKVMGGSFAISKICRH